MREGTIKKLTEKGYGFIATDDQKDVFFHMSAVREVSFEELFEGQRVSYEEEAGPKGPRAVDVTPT